MSIEILDPTHEAGFAGFTQARRLRTLAGATVAIVSNGKQGTRPFFDAFEQALRDEHAVAQVLRLTKGNYSAPMEPGILQQAAGADAIVAGIGD